MNIRNNFFIAIGALLLSGTAFAQPSMMNDKAQDAPANNKAVTDDWMPSLVKDGAIVGVDHIYKVEEWNPIREIDVAWKRRVWREIDIRQKQNDAFRYVGDENTGGGSFIEILIHAVKTGKVAAYSTVDDRFTIPLDLDAFNKMLFGSSDSSLQEDPITGEQIWVVSKNEFNINSVTKYQLKEDWIFDRNLGRLVVRIIGIAPLIDRIDENTGAFRYATPMFWLYYPDLRRVLANYEVYNPQNDVHRITWTDYLDNRYFSSYVIKTSANNPTNRRLPANDLRALQEGQEQQMDIIHKEMDMWEN